VHEYHLTIDGQKVLTPNSFDVLNPATEELVARCPQADASHLEAGVVAAKRAFNGWSQESHAARQQKIMEIAALLEGNTEELARLLTLETGKPISGFGGFGSLFEVGGAVAWCRATASLDLPVEIIQDDSSARVEVHRKPLGVVGSITPWNVPLLIGIWHVMPALLAGNTVVIKPSEYTPLSTLKFVELANRVLPPGVLNVVTGDGSLGGLLSSHQDIKKIVFTGSTSTGKKIMQTAAGNLKRLTLELGGNDAAIVLPDVNVDEVAPKLFGSVFINSGQVCAAIKRMYVHEDIYDAICAALSTIAQTVTLGNGLEEVDFGPVQNKAQLDRVCELADVARAEGGRFLTGGAPLTGKGYFFPLTLVADLKNGSRLVDEEPFGPIVPIIKYSDIDEVIAWANDSNQGLGGSIWTQDTEKAAALSNRLECGTVWINDHGAVQPNAPFGGVKDSGVGVEFGLDGLKEYTSIQTVIERKT
jgi:acyl-CoA reductase-like NAD-dependent aldehyde dehydrogenase